MVKDTVRDIGRRRTMRENAPDRLFNLVNYSIVTVALLVVAYPLIFIVSASFSSPAAVASGSVLLLPVGFTLDGYRAVFSDPRIMTGFANTIFYTSVGTVVSVVLTTLAAYPLSRADMHGRNVVMALFVFTMFFSGGMIPTYLVVRSLGLMNNRFALILPQAIGIWNMIIMRTYLQATIPTSLLEAAQLDGCDDFRFLAQVVLPVSGPIVAVLTLYYAVGQWNSFFPALIYLSDARKFPLQLILRDILVQHQISEGSVTEASDMIARQNLILLLKYSVIVVASLPILALYPFVQRYFIRGIMIGSLKG